MRLRAGTAPWRLARVLATVVVVLAAACGDDPPPRDSRAPRSVVGLWSTERATVEGPGGEWTAVPLDIRVRLAEDGTLSLVARFAQEEEHARSGTWRLDGETVVLLVTHEDGVPLPEREETRARREKDRLVMETNDPRQRSRVVLRRAD
jgi:hypothetical protein